MIYTIKPRLSGLLDYQDFFLWSQFGHEYLLVTLQDPLQDTVLLVTLQDPLQDTVTRSVAIYFLKLQHWKVQSNARVFCSQRAKAALALVVTNEGNSNEFWLAQSCVVARWNFTLYGLLGVVWKRHNNAGRYSDYATLKNDWTLNAHAKL